MKGRRVHAEARRRGEKKIYCAFGAKKKARRLAQPKIVMTRLVRVIHVFLLLRAVKTWMARINRAMTVKFGFEK